MMEWQPIETAPKDGALLLLCDARVDRWQLTAFYEDDGLKPEKYVWHTLDGLSYMDEMFTHWMPLQDPPVKS